MSKDNKKGLPVGLLALFKALVGLYIIGHIMSLNEFMLAAIGPHMIKLGESQFMSAQLVPWANLLFKPVRSMVWLLPMLIPVSIVAGLVILGVSKLKFVSEKERKIFSIVLFVILLITL